MGQPRRRDQSDRSLRAEERDRPYGIEETIGSGSQLRPVPSAERTQRAIPSGMLRRDDPRRRDVRHDRVYREKRRIAHDTLRTRLAQDDDDILEGRLPGQRDSRKAAHKASGFRRIGRHLRRDRRGIGLQMDRRHQPERRLPEMGILARQAGTVRDPDRNSVSQYRRPSGNEFDLAEKKQGFVLRFKQRDMLRRKRRDRRPSVQKHIRRGRRRSA